MADGTTVMTKIAAHAKLDLLGEGSAATDWSTLSSLRLTMQDSFTQEDWGAS